MKKNIIGVFTIVLLLVSLFTLASCSFNAPKVEDVKANLEALGYTVTVKTGSEYVNSDENEFNLTEAELDNYLYAKKGDDEIYMFYFSTIDLAEANKDFMNFPKLLSGQTNELIYFATRQARKDAKL